MNKERAILSKDALYILGVIADGPTNPYTICKLINHKRRNLKSTLPLQTVYSVVKALHRKKLITCKVIRDTKMPTKTSYSITTRGKEVLKKGTLSFLSEPQDPFSELQVALTVMGYLLSSGDLDKDAALNTLKTYRSKIKGVITAGKRMLSEESDHLVADYVLMGIQGSLRRLKNDVAEVDQFIGKLEKTSRWDYSPIPFWRNEIVGKNS